MSDYKHIITALSSIGVTHSHYFGVCGRAIDIIESLQRENAALQSLADTAGMDAERAITRADKAELDLKCLQESAVDAKAYQALQRENEAMRSATNVIQQRASAITPEMREVLKRAFALAREVEESELAEDLCGILIETDPYRNPHLNTGGMGDE